MEEDIKDFLEKHWTYVLYITLTKITFEEINRIYMKSFFRLTDLILRCIQLGRSMRMQKQGSPQV